MLTVAAPLAMFVYGLNSAILGVLLPDYSLSLAQKGNIGLANALGLAVASLAAGPLVDFKGKKTALALGLFLIVAGLLSAANNDAYPMLMVTYFGLGVGGGVVTMGANALVAGIASERRGSALNLVNVFYGLGGIVTTFAASYVLRPAALCYAAAGLAALTLVINLRARIPANSQAAALRFPEVRGMFANSSMLLFSLLLFFYVACEVGVWNWLKAYLLAAGFRADRAGGVVGYGFAFGLLSGRLLASRILLRVPPMPVILAAGALIAVATWAMLNLRSEAAITAAVFGAGLAMAPVYPTTLAIISDKIPRATATAMGIAITSGWLGLAVSSRIIGNVAAVSTLRQGLLLLPASATAMVLVSMVLRSQLRRTVTV